VRIGIEESFLTAYREGSFHYLLIVADRVSLDVGLLPS
jgi:geranyl diphosphate 2-C-methyltransferase